MCILKPFLRILLFIVTHTCTRLVMLVGRLFRLIVAQDVFPAVPFHHFALPPEMTVLLSDCACSLAKHNHESE